MDIILDYKGWNSINEGLFWDVVEKEAVNGTNHKIKVKYIDANNIKVKAVNDYDMVKPDGTIDPNLPAAIVNFLKTHDGTDFAREYPQLQDINTFYKDNFFTYNVKKENDRRQVVIFSLQKRANFKGITPETKVLSDAQATQAAQTPEGKNVLAASDKSLSQNTAQAQPQAQAQTTGSVKLTQPVAIANLAALGANTPLFKMIDELIAGLLVGGAITDPKAKAVLDKAADELSAKQIGDNTTLLIKGLMAGLGISQFTDKYGRKKDRTLINQIVVDKLATLTTQTTAQNSSKKFYLGLDGRAIFEQEEDTDISKAAKVTFPGDFKMDAFLKAIVGTPEATTAPTTGDIKLPEGGLVKDKVAKGDAELKKVQQLIIDKFAKKLANSPLYKKFAGFGADGAYGPTTEKLIAGLKAGFGLADKSGSTITAELINKIQTEKIDESYIGINGDLFEGFDLDSYESTVKSYSPTATAKSTSVTGDGSKSEKTGGIPNKSMLTDADMLGQTSLLSSFIKALDQDLDAVSKRDGVKGCVDALDGFVSADDLNYVLAIVKALDGKKYLDDSQEPAVKVPAMKRFLELYSEDEGGDNLIDDVQGVGTRTLPAGSEKIKTTIINLINKQLKG